MRLNLIGDLGVIFVPMKKKSVISLLVLCFTASIAFANIVKTDTSVGYERDGEMVWQFSYSREEGKPFFHPLRVPGGPVLTELKPADHAWHYGLWFSWKHINEVNYWEQNVKTGKAQGETRWSEPSFEELADGGIIIRMRIDYVHPSGRVDLAEYRDMVISAVGRNGKYTIDWTSHFTAGPEGAYLDRTPLPGEPGGKLWGGYGGLSARLANGNDPVEFVSIDDPLEDFVDNRMRPRTQAIGVSVFPNQRHAGSIAVLADPRNVTGDHPWYLINGQPGRFFCAAVMVPGPIQLEAGEVWELSYRLVIRPRHWDEEDLETEMFRWLKKNN